MTITHPTRFNAAASKYVSVYAWLIIVFALLSPVLLEFDIFRLIKNLVGGAIGLLLVKYIKVGDCKMIASAALYFTLQTIQVEYGDFNIGVNFGMMLVVAFNFDDITLSINVLSLVFMLLMATAWYKNNKVKM
ncbi:hypothetical protein [Pseudoalteromonas aurantia]|uniref:Uncharacterized protein n=1 Tax=Pseudoalteromonas aurantia TaxID=43654 RepID=A0ABY2W273_9GAMM|nr:hypothetical protein [Pseudoalteromonas aurantia]TMO59235.1 hypothetical protein CWC18_16250 [Pseudoalteromonas aurantia]TMO78328.1 hypothetical protein CWC20_01825 [Pseudoalteromonas aurantia]